MGHGVLVGVSARDIWKVCWFELYCGVDNPNLPKGTPHHAKFKFKWTGLVTNSYKFWHLQCEIEIILKVDSWY